MPTIAVTATRFTDSVANLGLTSLIDNALAPLLTNNIVGAQLIAQDLQRKQGKEYNFLLTYESTGADTLTDPFQVKVVQGISLDDVVSQLNDFKTTNPSFFFSTTTFQHINDLSVKPFVGILFYTSDASGGANNWQFFSGNDTGVGVVTSVFGRAGTVVAVLNDYAASLVDNDSTVTGATVKDALETLGTAVAGGAPGGSGTELQYRAGASTFGGVTASSWDGSILTLGNSVRLTGTSPTLNIIASSGEAAFLRLGEDFTTPMVIEFDGSGSDKGLHFYGTVPGKASSLLIERDTNRVLVRDPQNATSLSTGALQVTAGGASIAQDLVVGGIGTINGATQHNNSVLNIRGNGDSGNNSYTAGNVEFGSGKTGNGGQYKAIRLNWLGTGGDPDVTGFEWVQSLIGHEFQNTYGVHIELTGVNDEASSVETYRGGSFRMRVDGQSTQAHTIYGVYADGSDAGANPNSTSYGIYATASSVAGTAWAGYFEGELATTNAIQIGNTTKTDDGLIRWTGSDFEGRKSGAWESLTGGGSGSTDAVTKDIAQALHGLIVGDWIRLDGAANYIKALADTAANAEVVGVVSAVPDVNNFTVTTDGYVTGLPAVAADTGFVLDPSTAGAMTSTAPSVNGQINRFIFRSDGTTTGYVQILRGVEVGDPAFTSVANATAANLLWKSNGLDRVLVETGITELSGGNVGIGTATPDATSLLDITSTTLGFLKPRMTTAQRDAIASPADGLGIHNTTVGRPEYFDNLTDTWSGGASGSSVEVFVRSIADLPAPAASVITLADNIHYKVLQSFNTDGNQIAFGAGTEMTGISNTITVITGTTAVALITANGTAPLRIQNMGFDQEGAGDLLNLTSNAAFSSFFTECRFVGAPVRLVSGGFAGFITCTISGGAQIIQDASGGVTNFSISDNSVIFDDGAIDGVILFESGSGSAGSVFIMRDSAAVLLSASVGIRVVASATVGDFEIINTLLGDAVAGATGLVMEDPADVTLGSLTQLVFSNAGTKLACKPVSSSNFASPDADPRDVGFDGTNLLSCDPSTAVNGSAYQHTGVTSTIGTTLTNAVFDAVRGVAWARGNLLSIVDNGATGLIQIHDGFSVTVDDSFLSPAANPVGIAFDGTDIISLDSTVGRIYIHDGLTSTILTDFASPAGTDSSGITYNGINILVSDSANNLIYVMDRTGTVKYSFAGTGTLASGITTTDIGAVVSDSTATATMYVFDHHVTFDQSSETWQMMANAGITDSADRGGSVFETADPLVGVSLAVTQNVWRDIEDGGTDIFYGSFQDLEKCQLSDEENGEMLWTSSRDRGHLVSGIATFSRDGGGGDTAYELAVVINGMVQRDSVVRAVLATAAEFKTMMTIPITRDLTDTDTVKIQIRNISNTNAPEFVAAKLAIN